MFTVIKLPLKDHNCYLVRISLTLYSCRVEQLEFFCPLFEVYYPSEYSKLLPGGISLHFFFRVHDVKKLLS